MDTVPVKKSQGYYYETTDIKHQCTPIIIIIIISTALDQGQATHNFS